MLTSFQYMFLDLIEERFELSLDQLRMTEDEIPYFTNLAQVEQFLDDKKKELGLRDTRDL